MTQTDILPDDYVIDNESPRIPKDQGHLNNIGLILLKFFKQTEW
jgi:hypothetical protein